MSIVRSLSRLVSCGGEGGEGEEARRRASQALMTGTADDLQRSICFDSGEGRLVTKIRQLKLRGSSSYRPSLPEMGTFRPPRAAKRPVEPMRRAPRGTEWGCVEGHGHLHRPCAPVGTNGRTG